jgi:hypothetical protein
MKVLDFLKSLVLPSKIARYKTMSALIALFIFVLITYLLSIPFGSGLAKSSMEYQNNYHFLALQEIELDEENKEANESVLEEILNLECSVNAEGILECSGITENTVKEYSIVYNKDGVKKNIHIYYDFFDSEAEEEPTINIEKDFSKEKYPYQDKEEHYFLLITKQYLFYQAHQLEMGSDDLKAKHNDVELSAVRISLDYKTFMPELDLRLDDPFSYGTYVILQLLTGYSEYARSTAFFQTFLITILFPLLMVFLFWLFFRKTGRLTRFKEYYNVAAISNIIPFIIAFGVAWIYPVVLNWYIFIFSIYYLFVLFRINNAPSEY